MVRGGKLVNPHEIRRASVFRFDAYLKECLSDVCSKNEFSAPKLQEQLQEFRTQPGVFIEHVIQ